MDRKGKFVDADGVRTHYYEKGKGPVVVLVHGGNMGSKEASGNSWTWSRNFDALAKRFRVIAVDKLGQGYTGNPKRDADYTMDATADHLAALLRKLKIVNAHLVGHSRGGYTVTKTTLDNPDLVATCTVVDSNSTAPGVGLNEVVLANPPHPPLSRECQRWVLERYSWGHEHIDDDWLDVLMDIGKQPKYKTSIVKMYKQGLKGRVFMPSLHHGREAIYAKVRDVGMRRPTMVMWGYNDPTALLEQGYRLYDLIAATERRAYMHILNRAGHFSMREQPEQFNEVLTGFVRAAM